MRLNPKNEKMLAFFHGIKMKNDPISASTRSCLKEIYDAIMSCRDVSRQNIKKSESYVSRGPASSSENSFYMPLKIKRFLESTPCYYTKYESIQNGRRVFIHFCTYKKVDCREYVLYMLNVICVLDKFSRPKCLKSKDFHVYVYLTPFAKVLTESVIGVEHINTGINVKTMNCSDEHHENINEITIYREEDWFKVFIHEAIHSFRLDFNETGKMHLKKTFPIATEFNLFEAYTEFWAEMINIMYCAITQEDGFDNVMKTMNDMIQIERRFSLYQAMKILKHMDLTYDNVFATTEKYREETHVFAYFILKQCFMYNFNEFVSCCKKNGRTLLDYDEKKIDSIVEFIKHRCKCLHFLKDIKYMEKLRVKDRELLNTCKMTLFELN